MTEHGTPTPDSTLAETHDLPALRALAEDAAVRVREHVLERRRTGIGWVIEKGSAIDVVTEVDREAEHLLREILLTARPEDGFLGEEGTATIPGTSGVVWVVDPIDGTTNFVTGAGPFAVSVAAVGVAAVGEAEVGVAAVSAAEPSAPIDPATWRALAGAIALCAENSAGALVSAHLGGGATSAGRPIRVLDGTDLAGAIIQTGLAYDPAVRRQQAGVLAALTPIVRDLRIGGSAAADLCAVAEGRVAAYFERGLAPWDYAAGALIVTEAGGALAGSEGERPDGGLLVASGPAILSALLPIV
ncbi:inositol monophosphatase [Mycetocola tolaasinivorans]|uniref:inositol-phosphate phosphatase n=1 Tax=Mycetocola tolaasinivorans TaxID=76635 RepID=A0A3L7AC19_9MICO|nr:inositol monophosphatase family protein [Mycetocola tolaasinivorans]RLP78036.1 inositol monophosphatase [Mycetocola tolaasinivorans]